MPLITEVDKSKIFRARVPVQGLGKKGFRARKSLSPTPKVTRQENLLNLRSAFYYHFFLNKGSHGRKSLGKRVVGSCETGFQSLQLMG